MKVFVDVEVVFRVPLQVVCIIYFVCIIFNSFSHFFLSVDAVL